MARQRASLLSHSRRGLSNIATVIGDLLEDNKLDIAQLVLTAAHYPLSVVQRTGWMIEHAAGEIGKNVDLERLAVVANHRTERTLLSSSGPRRGHTDPRWRVVVNTEVESKLQGDCFRQDLNALVSQWTDGYDIDEAAARIIERLLSRVG
jgi:hypothetical protein